MADGGCICCDRMVMCRTRCAVFLSYEKRVPYFCRTRKSKLRLHSRKCSCQVNKVVHLIIRLSTCFHLSIVRIILNFCDDRAVLCLFSLCKSKIRDYSRWYERQYYSTHQHLCINQFQARTPPRATPGVLHLFSARVPGICAI